MFHREEGLEVAQPVLETRAVHAQVFEYRAVRQVAEESADRISRFRLKIRSDGVPPNRQ